MRAYRRVCPRMGGVVPLYDTVAPRSGQQNKMSIVIMISTMEVSRLRLLLRAREAPVHVTDRSILREIEPIVRAARERKETWVFIAQAVEAAGVRKQNGSPSGLWICAYSMGTLRIRPYARVAEGRQERPEPSR